MPDDAGWFMMENPNLNMDLGVASVEETSRCLQLTDVDSLDLGEGCLIQWTSWTSQRLSMFEGHFQ